MSEIFQLVGGNGETFIVDGSLQGAPGTAGTNGTNGQGVPIGGTAGQVPFKNSSTAYDLSFRNITESDVTNLTTDLAVINGKAQGLASTAVKATGYTASPGDFIPVDASSGNVTITLPTTPADKTRIGIKLINLTGTNKATIAAGGSDVFNKVAGATSLTLTLLNQACVLQYTSSTGIWYVQSGDLPLGQLDSRYQPLIMSATNNGVVVNDGTDQTLAIKTFLQAAQAAGAVAFFPPGVYHSGWFYVGAVNIFAYPGTVNIIMTQTNDAWNFGPTSAGTHVALTSNTAAGGTVINVPTAGISADDIILVGDTATLVGWNTSGNVPATAAVNLYRVLNVNSSSQLTLAQPLIYAMTTANSAYIAPTGMTGAGAQSNISVTGLNFTCAGGPTSTASFMHFWYTRNLNIDVTATGFTNAGLILDSCYQFKVNAKVSHFLDVAVTAVTGQFGYGVDISSASAHGDVNVVADQCRHAVALVGTGHDIRISGTSTGCTSGGWDAHCGFTDVVFANCTSSGDTSGFNLRGRRQSVSGGLVNNTTTAYGVFIFDNPQDVSVKGLVITNCVNEGVHIAAPNATSSGISIDDVTIRNVGSSGIDVTSGGTYTDLQITNTTIRNATTSAINLNRSITRGRIKNVIVEDNQGSPTTTSAVNVGVAATDVTVDVEVRNGIPITSGAQASTITLYGQSLAFTPTSFYYNTATTSRTDSSGVTVTSGSPTVLDSNIVASDTGRLVTGTGIPSNTYIGTVTPGVSFLLSSSPMTQTNVNATNNGTSITLTTYQFVVPTNCTKLFVYCFGAGGGGGSGALEPVSTTAGGGSGGAGGGWSVLPMLVSEIASQPVAIAIGAGGTGATGQTTNATVGIAGTGGGATSFGNYAIANGGAGGGGGTTSGGSAATGGSAMYTGGSGQNSSTSTGQSANTGVGASGGGSGGTLTSGNASTVGGSGTFSLVSKFTAAGGGGAGGVAGAINGGNGASPATAPANGAPGFGGGGGGAATPSSGNGGAGATGSVNGGGGGGGGGANNGNTSGVGGNGGSGGCFIVCS